jgi:hypothetical protein
MAMAVKGSESGGGSSDPALLLGGGSYVSAFPFDASHLFGIGMYGLHFQQTLDTAPKYIRTATGALMHTSAGRCKA